MGSRANTENKYAAPGQEMTTEEAAARDKEREAMLAKVAPDPVTVKEPKGAKPKAPPSGGRGDIPPKKPKDKTRRPAPRFIGGVTNPNDMDDYLRRIENGG